MKKLNYFFIVMALFVMSACGGGATTETVTDAAEEAGDAVEEAVSEATDAMEEKVDEAVDAVTETEVPDSLAGKGTDGQTYTDPEGRLVYNIAEVKPEFDGGNDALNKYLSRNIKYPASAKRAKNEGKVIVQFVVATDGSIVDVELAKAVEDESLNEEAMRVIKEMPNWTPGTQGGENVNVKYTLPVTFKLQ